MVVELAPPAMGVPLPRSSTSSMVVRASPANMRSVPLSASPASEPFTRPLSTATGVPTVCLATSSGAIISLLSAVKKVISPSRILTMYSAATPRSFTLPPLMGST